jgi:glutathione S-transferase
VTQLTLIIGNRNYSSWSLRGWLAARLCGMDFRTELVRLSEPGSHAALVGHSPAGRVPVLKHGDHVVWDSLAIIEYLAELCPQAGMWPAEADARAMARSISAEMHAGFAALREGMPMNLRKKLPGKGHGPGVADDIARICALWRDAREKFGGEGPFLFGRYSAADAMYTPVASRFRTYAVALDATCQAYADAVLEWPAFLAWQTAALDEPWIIPEDEVS